MRQQLNYFIYTIDYGHKLLYIQYIYNTTNDLKGYKMNKIDTQFTDSIIEIDKKTAQDNLKKKKETVKKLNAEIKSDEQILIEKGYAKIVEKEQTRLVPIAQARLLSKYVQKLIFRTIKVKNFTLT